jgi:acetyl/propionyl-CoA carboxylase alpha subunit
MMLERTLVIGGRAMAVSLRLEGARLVGHIGEGDEQRVIDVPVRQLGTHAWHFADAHATGFFASVKRLGDEAFVAMAGRSYRAKMMEEGACADEITTQEDFAASPMTGTVVKVDVDVGQAISAGEPLFVVEAMKMEYVVRAPRELVVADVSASAGDRVELGQVIVSFEEQEDDA